MGAGNVWSSSFYDCWTNFGEVFTKRSWYNSGQRTQKILYSFSRQIIFIICLQVARVANGVVRPPLNWPLRVVEPSLWPKRWFGYPKSTIRSGQPQRLAWGWLNNPIWHGACALWGRRPRTPLLSPLAYYPTLVPFIILVWGSRMAAYTHVPHRLLLKATYHQICCIFLVNPLEFTSLK